MGLNELTAHEILDKIEKKEVSCEEVTRDVFRQIEKFDKDINAYVFLDKQEALKQADVLKKEKPKNSLCGIPVAVKDNICAKHKPTTCSSRILSGFKPPYDASVIGKLKASRAIFVGKTNMDEFAFGSSTETSCFGPTRNPWNLKTIPGGSSGGSAAAVSADETILAIGSDTGGSIRQPAAMCGVVGLKPTYGRISRFGLIAFASSLDQIGTITKDVEDAALFLTVIAGYDHHDSTSVNLAVPDYTKSFQRDIKGLKIAVPREYFGPGIDREVKNSVQKAIEVLSGLGAECEEVMLPHTEYALSVYYILAPAEASSNLARYDGIQYGYRAEKKNLLDTYFDTRRQGFGQEVKRRIILGTYALSSGYYEAYYLKAQKVRTLIKDDFDKIFSRYDLILTPTSPTAAFNIGEKIDDPLKMYLSDILTIPVNLAGLPAISVPCGFTASGLPVGLQIIAKPFNEEAIFKCAYAFEQNTDHHLKKPKLIHR
ncbi:MAG: Asp-tRNA(Asn)/Glu-tRNA(Gln) amidotransferase subunit GatA [Candidatus Omnitrophota bacterium]|nr:Asp-tRNA(Asn)/Glu-tRNA(Gln) amidotransferase subunit GatA [Candidatus Omnitrophota bacterium]